MKHELGAPIATDMLTVSTEEPPHFGPDYSRYSLSNRALQDCPGKAFQPTWPGLQAHGDTVIQPGSAGLIGAVEVSPFPQT